MPVPVDVPQASFVPIRNQWVGNNTEYNPTFEIPENVTRLGLYWTPCKQHGKTTADYIAK